MLSFRSINIIFSSIIFILIILISRQVIDTWWLVIPLILYFIILFIGVVNIQYNFFINSINKLKDPSRLILSFDDGPHPENTPKILDLLEEYQIKAQFFVIGKNAEEYPKLLKEIKDRGHIIGNHSYSHASLFDIFSVNKMITDVNKANEIIENITGEKPVYFRPPYGITNPRINKLIQRIGIISVGWSFRSYDTGKQSNEKITARMKKNIKGGEILLFHDNVDRTYSLLKHVLPWLSSQYNLKNNSL